MAGRRIEYVALEDVRQISHRLATEKLGWDEPIPDFDTRYPGVLESCLNTPLQTYDRKQMYRGLVGKGAMLLYLMVKNHPFKNGNKRVAIVTLLLLLHKNHKWLYVSNEDFYRFAVTVAESDPEEMEKVIKDIEKYLRKHMGASISNPPERGKPKL